MPGCQGGEESVDAEQVVQARVLGLPQDARCVGGRAGLAGALAGGDDGGTGVAQDVPPFRAEPGRVSGRNRLSTSRRARMRGRCSARSRDGNAVIFRRFLAE